METVVRAMEKKRAQNLSVDSVKNTKIISNTHLLKYILENDLGIISFVDFVKYQNDISMVLFLIEILQWLQAQMRETVNNFSFAPIDKNLMNVVFAESIPLSAINANTETNWFEKYKLIHAKYY